LARAQKEVEHEGSQIVAIMPVRQKFTEESISEHDASWCLELSINPNSSDPAPIDELDGCLVVKDSNGQKPVSMQHNQFGRRGTMPIGVNVYTGSPRWLKAVHLIRAMLWGLA
jgi:hypothetical protein